MYLSATPYDPSVTTDIGLPVNSTAI